MQAQPGSANLNVGQRIGGSVGQAFGEPRRKCQLDTRIQRHHYARAAAIAKALPADIGAALDKAMTEVTNGVGPGSSARAPPTETNNNRDRAGSSASGASGSSKKENGVKGEEEEEEEEKEDGELSSQDINLPTSSSQQQDIRTVFQDPDNFNVKHPLASRWTLWFDNPSQRGMSHAKGSKESWGDDLNKVVDIDCVEEFWG